MEHRYDAGKKFTDKTSHTMKNATESQNTQILSALINGRKITPLDALDWFGCFRLSARISELKSVGWKIEKETVVLSSGKRIARYYMDIEKT